MSDAKTKKVMAGEVLLLNWRLSFADLYQPGKPMRDQETGEMREGKFKANFLQEKGTANFKSENKKIQAASHATKVKKYGEDEKKWPKYKPEKVFMRDGDLEDWDGYEGCIYISASTDEKPQLITRHKDSKGDWIEAKPGQIYSGCYVNALIQLWCQDNVHGKRLNARLKVVQFHAKGEAFSSSGPVDVNEKFGSIEEDDGEGMGALEDHSEGHDEDDDDDGLI